MDLVIVKGTVIDKILVLVLVPRFVIRLRPILGILFVDLNDTILNETFLKAHAFFFEVFLCLEAIHGHVMSEAGVCISDEHFNEMSLGDGA